MDPFSDDDDPVEVHNARAADPAAWQMTARSFICAANYLLGLDAPAPADFTWVSRGWNRPAVFLYAVAAENLVKAIRIAQGKPAIADGRLHRYFTKHDLLMYAREADMCPRADEEELLQRLSHVLRSGKYPIAKGHQEDSEAWTFESKDTERIWAMLERFDAALRATGARCLPPFDIRNLGRQ